jgi:hypothetical protein
MSTAGTETKADPPLAEAKAKAAPVLAEDATDCKFKSWDEFKVHLKLHHRTLYAGNSGKQGAFWAELFKSDTYQTAEQRRIDAYNNQDAARRLEQEQLAAVQRCRAGLRTLSVASKQLLLEELTEELTASVAKMGIEGKA